MIKYKYLIHISIILAIFIFDRLSKAYVISLAENLPSLYLNITSFINLTLVWNSGIGFGLLQFDKNVFYDIVTLLILLVNLIIIYLFFFADNLNRFFFSMILGGSFGNLFDRIYFSAVPDFIDLNYNGYHWFVFNVADIFITIGIFLLILSEIFKKKNEK